VEEAADLESRLRTEIALRRRCARSRRPPSHVTLEQRIAREIGQLAERLNAKYDPSEETARRLSHGTKGFKPLPQLVGQTGRAKSYAERLFEFPQIGPLTRDAARLALEAPAARHGVAFAEDALARILRRTQADPYFLQEWGKHRWNCAKRSPISHGDTGFTVPLFDQYLGRVLPAG